MQHGVQLGFATDMTIRHDLADQPGSLVLGYIALRFCLMHQDIEDGFGKEFVPGVVIGDVGIVQPKKSLALFNRHGHVAVNVAAHVDDIILTEMSRCYSGSHEFIQRRFGHAVPLENRNDYCRNFLKLP